MESLCRLLFMILRALGCLLCLLVILLLRVTSPMHFSEGVELSPRIFIVESYSYFLVIFTLELDLPACKCFIDNLPLKILFYFVIISASQESNKLEL